MSEIALTVTELSKSFRVPRAEGDADPRRERLSRTRDLFHALREVSFAVRRGETLGVIGANGSGKSTLLKILCGVMAADGGGFEAHGRIGALLELGAGFHPDLSGIDNVYLNGALLGLNTRQIDGLLPEIIAFSELERFMDMPVKHFSSGMTARLGFAVATRLAPEILLMDETFAAGDARFQAKALARVAAMKSEGHTLLMVSHNMEVILGLCDRVIWIDHGKLHREGAPAEIVANYHMSQQRSMHQIHHLRGALGMSSIFGNLMRGEAPVRIAEAKLTAEAERENDLLLIPFGADVRLELNIEHANGNTPGSVQVETAWVRADHRIIAQGRSTVELNARESATACTLRWNPWKLTEGEYRLAIALTPAEPAADGDPAPHYQRRLDCGGVRVITPNTAELPALTKIVSSWSI